MNKDNLITIAGHTFLDTLDENSIVIDLGASDGAFTKPLYDKYGCRIWAYEPNPDYREGLERLMKSSPGKPHRILIGNRVIYDDIDVVLFAPKAGKTSSSLYATHPSVSRQSTDKEAVSFLSLVGSLCRTNDFVRQRRGAIDLVKIDIEGAEMQIFLDGKNIPALLLCRQITVEFHDDLDIGITESDVGLAIACLNLLGFTFINNSKPSQPKHFDCLFVRNP